jgi:hypothetical protein
MLKCDKMKEEIGGPTKIYGGVLKEKYVKENQLMY